MSLPVLRLGARGFVRLSWQTDTFLAVNTHWLGRRYWCCEDQCPGCELAPTRTVCYWVALWDDLGTWRPVLVETTPNELARVEALAVQGGWRLGSGLQVEASRNKSRSPIRFEPIADGGLVLDEFTGARRALAAAAVLAGVPLPKTETDLRDYFERVQPAVRQLLERAIASAP